MTLDIKLSNLLLSLCPTNEKQSNGSKRPGLQFFRSKLFRKFASICRVSARFQLLNVPLCARRSDRQSEKFRTRRTSRKRAGNKFDRFSAFQNPRSRPSGRGWRQDGDGCKNNNKNAALG